MNPWVNKLKDFRMKTFGQHSKELEEAPLIQNQIGAVQSMAGRLETMLTNGKIELR